MSMCTFVAFAGGHSAEQFGNGPFCGFVSIVGWPLALICVRVTSTVKTEMGVAGLAT